MVMADEVQDPVHEEPSDLAVEGSTPVLCLAHCLWYAHDDIAEGMVVRTGRSVAHGE